MQYFAFLSLAAAGTVGLNIQQSRTKTPRGRGDKLVAAELAHRLGKRGADYVPESLSNGFYQYYVDMYLGSDRQYVRPMIDTGSSDLWVMQDSNPYCVDGSFNCTNLIFDPSTSSTFRNLSEPYTQTYVDTTAVLGFYGNDTIAFGDDAV